MSDLTPIKTAIAVHKNVFTALAVAQLAMDPVKKGALNPAFKGEGKPKGTAYADLADVVQAVREALNSNGLAFFHQIIKVDGDQVMRTVLAHGDSDTSIHCDVPLIVDRQNMQGMKSATTYAKRIGLESVTGVAPEDDDGNAAAAAAPPRQEQRRAEPTRGPDPSAVDIAVNSLDGSETIDQLQAIWSDLPRAVQGHASVIEAKDKAKARLSKPADTSREDEIPY